jgi:hypothetical protein
MSITFVFPFSASMSRYDDDDDDDDDDDEYIIDDEGMTDEERPQVGFN